MQEIRLPSEKFEHFCETINISLNSYYDFAVNHGINRGFMRNLKISIDNCFVEYLGVKEPISNAFAIYEETEDRIVISEQLVEFIRNFALNITDIDHRATVIIDTALIFCAFHELGHLLLGHCQLLSISKFEERNKIKDYNIQKTDLYHLLEFNADTFAAQRLAEKKLMECLDGKHISVLGYHDFEEYIDDLIWGINIFFMLLSYFDSDGETSVNPNNYDRSYNIDNKFGNHPPAIFRNFCVLKSFIMHLKCDFGIRLDYGRLMNSILYRDESLNNYLSNEEINDKYKAVIDGTYNRVFNEFTIHWFLKCRLLLKDYSRIKLF